MKLLLTKQSSQINVFLKCSTSEILFLFHLFGKDLKIYTVYKDFKTSHDGEARWTGEFNTVMGVQVVESVIFLNDN